MTNIEILIDCALEYGVEEVPHDILIVLCGYEKLPQKGKIEILERVESIFDRPHGSHYIVVADFFAICSIKIKRLA